MADDGGHARQTRRERMRESAVGDGGLFAGCSGESVQGLLQNLLRLEVTAEQRYPVQYTGGNVRQHDRQAWGNTVRDVVTGRKLG